MKNNNKKKFWFPRPPPRGGRARRPPWRHRSRSPLIRYRPRSRGARGRGATLPARRTRRPKPKLKKKKTRALPARGPWQLRSARRTRSSIRIPLHNEPRRCRSRRRAGRGAASPRRAPAVRAPTPSRRGPPRARGHGLACLRLNLVVVVARGGGARLRAHAAGPAAPDAAQRVSATRPGGRHVFE